jgi:hypothetical protein
MAAIPRLRPNGLLEENREKSGIMPNPKRIRKMPTATIADTTINFLDSPLARWELIDQALHGSLLIELPDFKRADLKIGTSGDSDFITHVKCIRVSARQK